MALGFYTKPTATIKATDYTQRNKQRTIPGVTSANTTVANAATQINKLFKVCGMSIIADDNMSRTITQEAEDDG